MIGWLTGGTLLVGLLLLLWYKSKQPYWHRGVRFTDLDRFLEVLLRRGQPDGFMVVRPSSAREEEPFVQFAKRVDRARPARLELAFPLASWSETYFGPLERALAAADIQYTVQPTSSAGVVRAYLYAPVDTVEEAHRIALITLVPVLGLNPENTLDVAFGGVDPE
jgi:hypothetical protein